MRSISARITHPTKRAPFPQSQVMSGKTSPSSLFSSRCPVGTRFLRTRQPNSSQPDGSITWRTSRSDHPQPDGLQARARVSQDQTFCGRGFTTSRGVEICERSTRIKSAHRAHTPNPRAFCSPTRHGSARAQAGARAITLSATPSQSPSRRLLLPQR